MGLDVCVFGHCVETPSLEDAGNWAAGFGDTVTFGGTKQMRRLINFEVNGDMDDMVDHCSDFRHWGGYGGDIAKFFDVSAGTSRFLERRGLLKGQEIVFNKNFRVAPLGGSKPKSPADFFPTTIVAARGTCSATRRKAKASVAIGPGRRLTLTLRSGIGSSANHQVARLRRRAWGPIDLRIRREDGRPH
jgi:hypothetical protein